MKKVFSVLVVLGVVIAMAACGNKKAEEEEALRIQDSIEQARIQDSTLQAEALIAEQQRIADSTEQARITDSIAMAEAAKTPAKKTTVQKVKEAAKAVKEEPATKKLRGGGTSN